MTDESKNFWVSLPGILTGIAAILTAATGFYVAISGSTVKPELNNHTQNAQNENPALQDIFILTAVTDDPDGYTNLRSMQSPTSQIVARVNQNERFHTYLQEGNWWQVKTAAGKLGYMHVSKIKVLTE